LGPLGPFKRNSLVLTGKPATGSTGKRANLFYLGR
jgi:hypothetical protein